MGYFLHTPCITVVRDLEILTILPEVGAVAQARDWVGCYRRWANYLQGPYPADYSNVIMAESFRDVQKQAAFKVFNAEFSRNGYQLLCRASFPLFSLNIIFHFDLQHFVLASSNPVYSFRVSQWGNSSFTKKYTHLSLGSISETSPTCRGASLGKKPPSNSPLGFIYR